MSHNRYFYLYESSPQHDLIRHKLVQRGYDADYTARMVRDYKDLMHEDLPPVLDTKPPSERKAFALKTLSNYIKFMDSEWNEIKELEEFARTQPAYDRERQAKLQRAVYLKEQREALPRNPITWTWAPDKVNLRQIEWLMQRKRNLRAAGKLSPYTFRFEMSELAKLRKKQIQLNKK